MLIIQTTLNVMMLGVNNSVEGVLDIEMMFMDPEQFKRKPENKPG